MTLTISALSLNGLPLSQPFVAHFDASGGSIGRAEQNTLMLPDPERHISRQHARISAEGSGYRITNLSAANVVTVAGRALSGGESAPIHHRDQLRIGGFVLEVSEGRREGQSDSSASQARTITEGRAALSASRASRAMAAARSAALAAAPVPVEAPASAPAPGDSAGSAPGHSTADELWQAFLAAADLRRDVVAGLDVDTMRTIGLILRAAVDGTVQLLANRALQHQGSAVDATRTLPGNNNPLAWSPDAQDPLDALLQVPAPGRLAGAAAVTAAMHELLCRQSGLSAGMEAALDSVLDRFAPPMLEARMMSATATADNLPPASRQARLWDLYLQHFEALHHEARHDFHTRFGLAYLEACEQHRDLLDAKALPLRRANSETSRSANT
jgi:predicted component of type VI protein secretion system